MAGIQIALGCFEYWSFLFRVLTRTVPQSSIVVFTANRPIFHQNHERKCLPGAT